MKVEVLNSFPVFVDELLACMHAMLVVVLSSVKILCFLSTAILSSLEYRGLHTCVALSDQLLA
jgi:hypothetical protein